MADGDAAAGAGLPLVASTDDVREGYNHHNATRDMIVNYVKPVASGGTGGTTPASARAGIGAVHDDIGTGLQLYSPGFGRLGFRAPGVSAGTELANSDVASGKVSKTGDEMSGFLRVNDHIYVPNAFAAVSGFVVAYINSDGRLSKGASTERVKKYITEIDPATLGDVSTGLYRFQMKGGDGSWRYGVIAERLAENEATQPFVVYDAEGLPESVDFISLLLAQNAQQSQQLAALTARVKALEGAGDVDTD
jgi:hypothetical protein